MEMEVWKPVKGFEGFYEISNTGRVKSLERISRRNNKPYKKKEKILTPIPMGNYLGIQLAINKNTRNVISTDWLQMPLLNQKVTSLIIRMETNTITTLITLN